MDDESRWLSISRLAAILLSVGMIIAVAGVIARTSDASIGPLQIYFDFYVDLALELISIGFTVLILDRLYTRREENRDKRSLITRLSESDEALARSALARLRTRGWLKDGTLSGAPMRHAKLTRTDLSGANLRNADLTDAELREATLIETDLTGARLDDCDLTDADLTGAAVGRAELGGARLKGANLRYATGLAIEELAKAASLVDAHMPDGSLYDGRFNLEGDVAMAVQMGFNPDDDTAMARFYGISLQEYRRADEASLADPVMSELYRTPAGSEP